MDKKGFSILELVIVITVIAVLSGIGSNTYITLQRTARNAQRKADLRQLQAALAQYYKDNGHYPSTCTGNPKPDRCPGTDTDWWGEGPNNPWGPEKDNTGIDGYIPELAPNYISILPRDQRHGNPPADRCIGNPDGALYLYQSDGIDYKMLAHCTPEGQWDETDSFFDPCRPEHAWQVSSSSFVRGTNGVTCNWLTNGW